MIIIITVNWENIACPKCDFARPKLDYAVTNVHLDRGISLRMEGEHNSALKVMDFIMSVIVFLAAYAAARSRRVFLWNGLTKMLRKHKTQSGRMELFDIGGETCSLKSCKESGRFQCEYVALFWRRIRSLPKD